MSIETYIPLPHHISPLHHSTPRSARFCASPALCGAHPPFFGRNGPARWRYETRGMNLCSFETISDRLLCSALQQRGQSDDTSSTRYRTGLNECDGEGVRESSIWSHVRLIVPPISSFIGRSVCIAGARLAPYRPEGGRIGAVSFLVALNDYRCQSMKRKRS